MSEIHLVRGDYGSYCERIDWNVRAFLDLESANAYAQRCRNEWPEILKKVKRWQQDTFGEDPADLGPMMKAQPDFVASLNVPDPKAPLLYNPFIRIPQDLHDEPGYGVDSVPLEGEK